MPCFPPLQTARRIRTGQKIRKRLESGYMIASRKFRLKSCRCFAAFFFGIIATFFLFVSAGAGTVSAATESTIHSAAEVDYPPFSIVDENGHANGFSVELLRAALKSMGRDVTFRTGQWADVRSWLAKGEVQALPLVGRTPEREADFDFTFPYMSLHGAIVVRDDSFDIRELGDLRGRTVAVMKGDNAEEFLRREDRGVDIKATATFEEALHELSRGRFDAVFIQRLVALRLIQENNFTNLRIVNEPIEGFRQEFCFAVTNGDHEMLALLNEGLALVMADGTYRHLHAKWFAALELPVNRRIVIGGDSNYPPFEYLDESGRPAGFNVDLTWAIARETGLDIEIRLGPWSTIIDQLARSEIDAVQGMLYSPQRDLMFDFSVPHTVTHHVIVVRTGDGAPAATVEALFGKHIVVQEGDILHDFLEEKGMMDHVTVVASQADALRELSEGKHDYALVARVTAMDLIKKHGWKNLNVGKQPILSRGYSYAVPQNHRALLAQLSEGLKIINDTGEYRRIYNKWFGIYEDSPLRFVAFLRYVAIFLIPLVFLVLAVTLWSWSLKKQVTRRTAELRESENLHRIAGQLARLGGWSVNLSAKEVLWSDEVAKIHEMPPGYRPSFDEAIRFYAPEFREKIASVFNECARNGNAYDEEMQIVTGKGNRVWVRTIGVAEYNTAGRIIAVKGGFQDITERIRAGEERKRLQEHLIHAQKMESVGRLAGGVAHDYNNMLSVILGYAEMAMEEVDASDPLQNHLREIHSAAKRSIDITKQLLAFARKQTISPQVLDLNDTVTDMLTMVRRLIGEDIDLSWRPGAGLWLVKMDPVQVSQILVNLCVNAKDAIGGVGRIDIETKNERLDEDYCAAHSEFVPGSYVSLSISDDGCGMKKETLVNIFEPFFTTKGIGKGTGLGLATVFGIVKQNNGFINVYSEPDRGAVFRIYLPRYSGQPGDIDLADVSESHGEIPRGRGETVLVVEDEAAILTLAVKILEILGYKVMKAESPGKAMDIAAQHEGKIDLVIADVVMPDMNGRDLVDQLNSSFPSLKALYMSGYTAEVIAYRGVLDDGLNFIQKPFSAREMAVKVRNVLDE